MEKPDDDADTVEKAVDVSGFKKNHAVLRRVGQGDGAIIIPLQPPAYNRGDSTLIAGLNLCHLEPKSLISELL
jgi:hypothetical protein